MTTHDTKIARLREALGLDRVVQRSPHAIDLMRGEDWIGTMLFRDVETAGHYRRLFEDAAEVRETLDETTGVLIWASGAFGPVPDRTNLGDAWAATGQPAVNKALRVLKRGEGAQP